MGLRPTSTSSSTLLTALVTNHAALLTGLTPDTGYYYAAYSKIGANVYVSSNFFFTTTNYVTTDSLYRSDQYAGNTRPTTWTE